MIWSSISQYMLPQKQIGLIGVLLLVLSPFLVVGPIVSGMSTAIGCTDEGFIYEHTGINPSEYRVTYFEPTTLDYSFYDGCNYRSSNLAPSVVGIVFLIGGVGVLRREQ